MPFLPQNYLLWASTGPDPAFDYPTEEALTKAILAETTELVIGWDREPESEGADPVTPFPLPEGALIFYGPTREDAAQQAAESYRRIGHP